VQSCGIARSATLRAGSAAKVVFARISQMKSYKSARDLSQKREILVVQVEFGKIISIERIE
jgi:hypothetical protein